MEMHIQPVINGVWMAVAVVWAATAMVAKKNQRTENSDARIGHLVTIAIAFSLLFASWARTGPLAWQVIPEDPVLGIAGLALTAAGGALAIWARVKLGGNWSAIVAIKEGHTLVRSGPYAVVRHPIYAGFLLAMLGTALSVGEVCGFLAVIVAFAAFLAKARSEEYFLSAQFGEQYLDYRRHVKTLIPYIL